MSGKPYRSGKARTVAEAQAKARAGGDGGRAKAARHRSTEPIETNTDFAGPFNTIGDYDTRLGPPMSWADVERREKVIGQILQNEASATKNEVELGRLLTAEDVAARDDRWNAAAAEQADLVQRLIDGMPNISTPQREWFLEQCRVWRRQFGERLSAVHS